MPPEKKSYAQQIFEAHMKAFNIAKRLRELEEKQNPFATITGDRIQINHCAN